MESTLNSRQESLRERPWEDQANIGKQKSLEFPFKAILFQGYLELWTKTTLEDMKENASTQFRRIGWPEELLDERWQF